jgi:hypothetical protein
MVCCGASTFSKPCQSYFSHTRTTILQARAHTHTHTHTHRYLYLSLSLTSNANLVRHRCPRTMLRLAVPCSAQLIVPHRNSYYEHDSTRHYHVILPFIIACTYLHMFHLEMRSLNGATSIFLVRHCVHNDGSCSNHNENANVLNSLVTTTPKNVVVEGTTTTYIVSKRT